MSDRMFVGLGGRLRGWLMALLLAGAAATPHAWGQVPALMPSMAEGGPAPLPELPTADPQLKQTTGCAGCDSGLGGMLQGGCASCGGCGSQCIPGRKPCCCGWGSEGQTAVHRFLSGVCECICCPDPCYEGYWTPIQDSAFFAASPRPITQMRLRWDNAWNFTFPDRAEYFWAAQRAPGGAVAPPPPQVPGARTSSPKGVSPPQREIDFAQFSWYTEIAVGRFSAFIDVPYREVNSVGGIADFSGFSDLSFGTKSLIVDCPLAQLAMQFKVITPTGQASHGLGTGHVSLEPSLLLGIRLARDTYLQTQWAYWIPIGGDQIYAGDIFHYHVSLNQVLWRPLSRVEFVGVFEFGGYSVLDGAYSLPAANGGAIPQRARTHIFNAGPGFRCFICDIIDFGVGSAFATTDSNFGDQWIRAEFRWRF